MGVEAAPALGTAHLECIAKALATLPAFGPTEAREVVMSHLKGRVLPMFGTSDFDPVSKMKFGSIIFP